MAAKSGARRRVFCASLADVFEDWQGPIQRSGVNLSNDYRASDGSNRLTMDDVRRRLFELIDATPNLDWLLLTKRPENIRRMWPDVSDIVFDWNMNLLNVPNNHMGIAGGVNHLKYRHNVWIGTSVENQEYLELRLPEIEGTKDLCALRFLSCEPLLGPLDFSMCTDGTGSALTEAGIGWVIAGGESGPEARPSHPDWFRSLRDQCKAAGVPFLFKQWGEWVCKYESSYQGQPFGGAFGQLAFNGKWFGKTADDGADRFYGDEATMVRIGKKAAGRQLDGSTHDGFPNLGVAR